MSCATTVSVNVFETGTHKTILQKIDSASSCRFCKPSSSPVAAVTVPPPNPVLIGSPIEAGEYPVLVFLHGYLLYNSFYSQLIQHIASHGFIVIAPQLYSVAGPDSTEEIKSAAATTNWLPEGLTNLLPTNVKPNLNKLALAGHSRGGKTAFALVLQKVSTTLNLKFSVLIGVDPVDGMDKGKQIPPAVLTYTPKSFELNMPVMVIGSSLGEVKKNPLFPPCAPKGVNHKDFFYECRKPACYFVVNDYGHLDMLDDETDGIRGKATYCLCKNGKCREPMRRFVGGIVVAFMKAYLEGDDNDLKEIRNGRGNSPVELQTMQSVI